MRRLWRKRKPVGKRQSHSFSNYLLVENCHADKVLVSKTSQIISGCISSSEGLETGKNWGCGSS